MGLKVSEHLRDFYRVRHAVIERSKQNGLNENQIRQLKESELKGIDQTKRKLLFEHRLQNQPQGPNESSLGLNLSHLKEELEFDTQIGTRPQYYLDVQDISDYYLCEADAVAECMRQGVLNSHSLFYLPPEDLALIRGWQFFDKGTIKNRWDHYRKEAVYWGELVNTMEEDGSSWLQKDFMWGGVVKPVIAKTMAAPLCKACNRPGHTPGQCQFMGTMQKAMNDEGNFYAWAQVKHNLWGRFMAPLEKEKWEQQKQLRMSERKPLSLAEQQKKSMWLQTQKTGLTDPALTVKEDYSEKILKCKGQIERESSENRSLKVRVAQLEARLRGLD